MKLSSREKGPTHLLHDGSIHELVREGELYIMANVPDDRCWNKPHLLTITGRQSRTERGEEVNSNC